MIGDDEAPYGEAISEYGYEAGSGGGRCIVVLRDEAADGTRPKLFSSGQTARRTAPPAFSKIDIDATWAGARERLDEIRGAPVDAGVEAEFVDGVAALRDAARDAHGAAALDLGDLPYRRADGAGGRGDHDGLLPPGHRVHTREPVDLKTLLGGRAARGRGGSRLDLALLIAENGFAIYLGATFPSGARQECPARFEKSWA